jgi:hypothetical protein
VNAQGRVFTASKSFFRKTTVTANHNVPLETRRPDTTHRNEVPA